ncbi:unnamed protein product, partial [Symbiodinium pilosum]
MGLFPRVLSSLARQLDVILHLLLARSVLDTAGALPTTLADFNCDLKFEGSTPTATGWTAQAVLAEMGDTFVSWPTSPFTTAAMQVAQLAPEQAFDNLVLLCILFATQYLNSTACTLRASARDKMAAFLKIPPVPGACFTGSCTGWAKWMQSGPYFTPFHWLYRRCFPTSPVQLDKSFCATGPAARTGLNWLLGFPPKMAKDSANADFALLYIDQLGKLQASLGRNHLLRPQAGDSAVMAAAKAQLKQHLDTLEGRAFACCEYSKFINFLLGGALI